jgi:hypothetical protein
MRPCHRAVANTPPSGSPLQSVATRHAAFTQLRKVRPLGRYFSRLLCVYCSLRPDDLLTILKMALSIAKDSVFPLPRYPSYEVLTFTSVGLPPTEHISFPPYFSGCAGAEYPPHLSSVYASLNTSRYPAHDSRPSGSLLLSREALSSTASCRFIPAHCNGDVTPTAQTAYRRVC